MKNLLAVREGVFHIMRYHQHCHVQLCMKPLDLLIEFFGGDRVSVSYTHLDVYKRQVLEPSVLPYLKGDETILEQEPLSTLAAEGELAAYQHKGFWQCMDCLLYTSRCV